MSDGKGAASAAPTPSLDELAVIANREHEASQTAEQSRVEHAKACGEALLAAKALMAHGEWLPWLTANFHATPRTAQQYMQLANTKRASHLESEPEKPVTPEPLESEPEKPEPSEPKSIRAALRSKTKPPSKPRKRVRGGEPTVENETGSVAHNIAVLNWVQKKTRAGYASKEIVSMSETGGDWPMSGKALSDGSLASCRAVIYHLEAMGARFPLSPSSSLKPGETLRKRKGKAAAEYRALKADVYQADVARMIHEADSLAYLLFSLDIEAIDLDESSLDMLTSLEETLLYLQEQAERASRIVEGRLGEVPLRAKIIALRSKTVANGATPEEEELALAAADRLERRLAKVLS